MWPGTMQHNTTFVSYGLTERKLYKKQIIPDTVQAQDVIWRWIRGVPCVLVEHTYKECTIDQVRGVRRKLCGVAASSKVGGGSSVWRTWLGSSRAIDSSNLEVRSSTLTHCDAEYVPAQTAHTRVPLKRSSMTALAEWRWCSTARKVTGGLANSNAGLPSGSD